jgi:hypothetical protein
MRVFRDGASLVEKVLVALLSLGGLAGAALGLVWLNAGIPAGAGILAGSVLVLVTPRSLKHWLLVAILLLFGIAGVSVLFILICGAPGNQLEAFDLVLGAVAVPAIALAVAMQLAYRREINERREADFATIRPWLRQRTSPSSLADWDTLDLAECYSDYVRHCSQEQCSPVKRGVFTARIVYLLPRIEKHLPTFLSFVGTRCVSTVLGTVPRELLYGAYCMWMQEHGGQFEPRRRFEGLIRAWSGAHLEGPLRKRSGQRSHQSRAWIGLALRGGDDASHIEAVSPSASSTSA